MVAAAASIVLSSPAAQFRLSATNGNTYALQDIAGSKGTVIIFICNHCPYVKAVIDRVVQDAKVLMAEGIGFAAICSNDAESYPEDFFANMRRFAETHDFLFPYLHDEDQSVARAYGALLLWIFSATTRSRNLDITAAWTRAARRHRRRMLVRSLLKPCARLLKARRSAIKCRRSGARSNGVFVELSG